MAALDPDNYIKLFRLDDSQDSTYPENVVIIPAGTKIFQTIFHSECRGRRQQITTMEKNNINFPDEGVGLLVKFRHELEELFNDCGDILGIAAVLWEDISRRLFDRGFSVTAKQCSNKWEALYSEYVEIARSDDEGRVSESRHFPAFEYLYKIRSEYIDSKILEDITEYLNSTPTHCTPTGADLMIKNNDKVETSSGANPSKNDLAISKREFSNLSNEEDSQMLNEAINAAQQILENNIRDFDEEQNEGIGQEAVENSCWRLEDHKQGGNVSGDKGEIGLSLAEEKSDDISRGRKLSNTIHRLAADKESEDTLAYQVFVRSEKPDLHWDSDATQCFLDLRLYVETSRSTKQSITRKYRSIVAFVSKKMALSGYQVSEIECKKKWDQIMRYYNKEIKTMKDKGGDVRHMQGVRKYFWQIDGVLKKSGLKIGGDNNRGKFHWDHQSIKKLIEIRIPMENAFTMFKRYVILWQYVASQMERHKYLLTYTECSIKWMELCEIYKTCLDSIKNGAKEENIGWDFYQDMRRGFERNAQSTDTIINYKCSTEPNDSTEVQRTFGMESAETSTQSSTSSASFSGSENPAVKEFDALSGMGNSNNENWTSSQDVETDACESTLKVTVPQCNLVGNVINKAESNAEDNVAIVGEPRASDSPQIGNDTKISTMNDCSLDIEDDFLVKPKKPETECTKMLPGAVSLDFRNALVAKSQLEKTAVKAVDNVANKSKKMTFNDPTIFGENQSNAGWTEEATDLMIKFKISRELKFKSPSFQEMDLWKEIATDMQSAGHNVSHDSCAAHWNQLMAAYKGSPSPENDGIIRPKYWDELKLTELPFTRSSSTVEVEKKTGNVNGINFKAGKFLWTDEAIRNLVKFRFSPEIRNLKKYGLPLTNMMQSAGWPTVTHIDVTRKWTGMYHSYRESLFRKEIGHSVKWQYFELMDSYIKGSSSSLDPVTQQKQPPFLWTPHAVRKFIDLKLSIENSYPASNRKGLTLLWKKVADAMAAAGFKVTNTECAIQWSFLVRAYMKTKKELTSGNGAVIGKYFIMMDKVLNDFQSANNGEKKIDEPIDFSIAKRKRNLEDGSARNTAYTDQGCSTMIKRKKVSENQETVDETITDLSWRITVPPLNCSPVDSSSEVKELRRNNIEEKSSADSSPVTDSISKKKEPSPILRFELDKNQQAPIVSISKEKCLNSTEVVLKDDDHLDSSKENAASAGNETRIKQSPATSIGKREDVQSRILCNQKPSHIALNDLQLQYPLINFQVLPPTRNNTLIQDRAVNSTEYIEGEDTNRKWSVASTHILIDLKIKHMEKFTGWPRPEIEWDKVKDQLAKLGHYYTSTECRQKWNSLKATYGQKIAEIGAEKSVHAWPYFAKIDYFHKMLGNRHHGFRYILPNKRAHDDDQEHSMPLKKFTVSLKPVENRVAPGILICNTLASIVVQQEKMIE